MEKLLNDEKLENQRIINSSISQKKAQILANPKFLKLAKDQLKDVTYDVIKNFRYFEFTDLNDLNNRNYYVFQRESDNSPNYMLINVIKQHPHKLNPDGTHTDIPSLLPSEIKEMGFLKAKLQAHPDDESLIDYGKFASDNYIKCKDFKSWLVANPLGSTTEYEAYKKANKDGQFCINLFHAKPNVCQDKINIVSNDKESELIKLRAEIERLTVENRTLKGQNQTLTIEITTLKGQNQTLVGENQALKGENKGLLEERDTIKVSLQEEDDLLAQLRTELASCKTSVKIDQLFTNIDSQREKKKGIFTKLRQAFSTKKGGYYEKYLKYKGKYLAAKQ
jgi:FtsZ-binding cell division protein ZapB